MKRDGPGGLYKGLGPQLLASVLSSALMLMVKEKISRVTTALLLWMFAARSRRP